MPSFLVLLPTLALAPWQAGGGGGFSGGGGDFSGGGGDDGAVVWILFQLVRLTLHYPRIGIPLIVVFVVVGFVGTRRGWWRHQERAIRHSRVQRRDRGSRELSGALRAHDPAFDEQRFLGRVRRAFHVAQDAWCAQDLEPLRPFVSDGVYERFSLQIEEQRLDGWRQGMEAVVVGPLSIVHVDVGRQFEVVTVEIGFEARIGRIDLASGKPVPGSLLPREGFGECWSFVRRRGTRSLEGEGLIEGKCPNCAAPLRMNRSARCDHCECLARNGAFDWVLAEITQSSEFRAESEAGVRGLATLLERDPGMNVQMLEDRASVAFWRLRAAERRADVAPLRRVAAEETCARMAAELERGKGPERRYVSDAAVGSVRTRGILTGREPAIVRALIEVVWDGRDATERDGKRTLDDRRRLFRTLFVFSRPADATTRLDDAFTTAHCGNCGAHDTGGTASDCPYCGAPRTGEGDWLLTGVHPVSSPEGRALTAALVDQDAGEPAGARSTDRRSASELVAWAARLAHVDGVDTAGSERRALQALAGRLEVPPERVEMLLSTASASGAVPVPRDPAEGRAWLDELLAVALADGHLSRDERKVLRSAAASLGLRRREFERSLTTRRGELYRESRAAKRARDQGLAAVVVEGARP